MSIAICTKEDYGYDTTKNNAEINYPCYIQYKMI